MPTYRESVSVDIEIDYSDIFDKMDDSALIREMQRRGVHRFMQPVEKRETLEAAAALIRKHMPQKHLPVAVRLDEIKEELEANTCR